MSENKAKPTKLSAEKAYAEGIALKEAVLAFGLLTEQEFDERVRPQKLIGPKK